MTGGLSAAFVSAPNAAMISAKEAKMARKLRCIGGPQWREMQLGPVYCCLGPAPNWGAYEAATVALSAGRQVRRVLYCACIFASRNSINRLFSSQNSTT